MVVVLGYIVDEVVGSLVLEVIAGDGIAAGWEIVAVEVPVSGVEHVCAAERGLVLELGVEALVSVEEVFDLAGVEHVSVAEEVDLDVARHHIVFAVEVPVAFAGVEPAVFVAEEPVAFAVGEPVASAGKEPVPGNIVVGRALADIHWEPAGNVEVVVYVIVEAVGDVGEVSGAGQISEAVGTLIMAV